MRRPRARTSSTTSSATRFFLQFRTQDRVERGRRWGFLPVSRTVADKPMTIEQLEPLLADQAEIGSPDYADEGMIQYLHTRRIILRIRAGVQADRVGADLRSWHAVACVRSMMLETADVRKRVSRLIKDSQQAANARPRPGRVGWAIGHVRAHRRRDPGLQDRGRRAQDRGVLLPCLHADRVRFAWWPRRPPMISSRWSRYESAIRRV